MIPVEPQPEPGNFSERVKGPGEKFLSEIAFPTSQQWLGKEYWQRVLPDMRKAYSGICSYSATWIPHSTGNHSIDHFIPKSQKSNLAYRWNNYRYVSARFNSRKGTYKIFDPFKLQPGYFIIDFDSFFIKPNLEIEISPVHQQLLWDTIKHLKLNDDEDLVAERQAWVFYFRKNEISFDHLKKKVPFIAFELERQNII